RGTPCILEDVADVQTKQAPALLLRRNGTACQAYLSSVEPGMNPYTAEQAAFNRVQQQLAGTGITVMADGLTRISGEANRALFTVIPWGIAGIILLLIIQTASLRYSVMIFLTIPFGILGSAIALYWTGESFGFMAILGITAMAGVAVNNAIVLVCGIRQAIDTSGGSSIPVIIEAAGERIEPILLSSLCTIGGMIPLYIYGGAMWQPLAVAMAAGVPLAAFISLLTLPVCTVIMYNNSSSCDAA
ncbi:hypothetical protein BVY04_02560, partial [bacterium M21]